MNTVILKLVESEWQQFNAQQRRRLVHAPSSRLRKSRVRCLLGCVGDGGLEGKGDAVSCAIEVGVREGVCFTREMSPLHELGHAEMLLCRPLTVT